VRFPWAANPVLQIRHPDRATLMIPTTGFSRFRCAAVTALASAV
jgi:hypothetical protein